MKQFIICSIYGKTYDLRLISSAKISIVHLFIADCRQAHAAFSQYSAKNEEHNFGYFANNNSKTAWFGSKCVAFKS